MSINKDKVLISLVVSKEDKDILHEISKRQDCSTSALIRKGIKIVISHYGSIADSKDFINSNTSKYVLNGESSDKEYNFSKEEFLDNLLNSALNYKDDLNDKNI